MNQAPMFWQRIIAIPFGLAMLATPAWAKDSFVSSGNAADAFFSSVDDSGCVHTDVALFVSKNTNVLHHTPGGPVSSFGSSAEIDISKYDTCTGTVLIGTNCYVDLSESDFQVAQSQLSLATLDTTFECFDFYRDRTFDVALDVTWTGFGEVNRQNTNTWYESVNGRFHTKFKGLFRSAAVSGTAFDGVTNLIAGADATATVREDNNAEVIFD